MLLHKFLPKLHFRKETINRKFEEARRKRQEAEEKRRQANSDREVVSDFFTQACILFYCE